MVTEGFALVVESVLLAALPSWSMPLTVNV
jgi:hypothetical protein